MPHLELADVSAAYGVHRVLDGVSLALERGEIMGLIGPSGSGKSTILRVLVGLLKPTAGEVRIDGEAIDYGRTVDVVKARGRCAIVFQQYNLFQNMTALDNVTIAPMKIKKRPRADAVAEGSRLLAKVGLGHKLASYPDELSGGQQQRVAIARALALKPEILLLDEVTAALDRSLFRSARLIRVLAREHDNARCQPRNGVHPRGCITRRVYLGRAYRRDGHPSSDFRCARSCTAEFIEDLTP